MLPWGTECRVFWLIGKKILNHHTVLTIHPIKAQKVQLILLRRFTLFFSIRGQRTAWRYQKERKLIIFHSLSHYQHWLRNQFTTLHLLTHPFNNHTFPSKSCFQRNSMESSSTNLLLLPQNHAFRTLSCLPFKRYDKICCVHKYL